MHSNFGGKAPKNPIYYNNQSKTKGFPESNDSKSSKNIKKQESSGSDGSDSEENEEFIRDVPQPTTHLQSDRNFFTYLKDQGSIKAMVKLMRFMLFPEPTLFPHSLLIDVKDLYMRNEWKKPTCPFYFDSFVRDIKEKPHLPFRDGTVLYKSDCPKKCKIQYWLYKCINFRRTNCLILCSFSARFYPETGQFIPIGRHHSLCYNWQINHVTFNFKTLSYETTILFKHYVEGFLRRFLRFREENMDRIFNDSCVLNSSANTIPFLRDPINVFYSKTLHEKHYSVYPETENMGFISDFCSALKKETDFSIPTNNEGNIQPYTQAEKTLKELALAVLINDFNSMYRIASKAVSNDDMFRKLYCLNILIDAVAPIENNPNKKKKKKCDEPDYGFKGNTDVIKMRYVSHKESKIIQPVEDYSLMQVDDNAPDDVRSSNDAIGINRSLLSPIRSSKKKKGFAKRSKENRTDDSE